MNGKLTCEAVLQRLVGFDNRMSLERSRIENATEFSPAARARRARQVLDSYKQFSSDRARLRHVQAEIKRTQLMAETANLSRLNPDNTEKVSAFFAQKLDWEIAQGGAIRQDINRVRSQVASQLEYIARGTMSQAAAKLGDTVKRLLPNATEAERRVLTNYAAEIGSIDREMYRFSRTPAIEEFNRSRISTFYTWVVNNTPLSRSQVDELVADAARASQAYDELLIMAQAVGVDIGETQGVAYIHRVLRTPFLKYIKDRAEDLFSGTIQGYNSLNSLLQTSRKFEWLVPEDKVALASVLGLGPEDGFFAPRQTRLLVAKLENKNLPLGMKVTDKQSVAMLRRRNPHSNFVSLPYKNAKELADATLESMKRGFVQRLNSNIRILQALSVVYQPAVLANGGVYINDFAEVNRALGSNMYTRSGFYKLTAPQITWLRKAGIPATNNIKSYLANAYNPAIGMPEITKFVGADYFTLADDTIIGATDSAAGKTFIQQEGYVWAVGRATDTTGSTYINPAANVHTINSSLSVFDVLAAQIRQASNITPKDLKELNKIIANKDEAALMMLARKTVATDFDGLIIRNTNRGTYASIDLGTVPDFYLNTPTQAIDDLFDPKNAPALLDYLRRRVGSEGIETLVDSGLLSKVGMASVELFEYMANKLELPFTSASQAINMNWRELYLDAAHKLKQSAGTSAFLTKLAIEGKAQNWMIDTPTFQQNASKYRKWSKINVDAIKAAGLNDELALELADMYVHPNVAVQIDGLVRMSTDPLMQSLAAKTLMTVVGLFKKQVLATVVGPIAYINRNIVEALSGSIGAGGNIYTAPVHIVNVAKFLAKGTLEHLDDTVPRYYYPGSNRTMTMRQAYREFLRSNLTGAAAGTTDEEFATKFFNVADYAKFMLHWALRKGEDIGPLERLSNLGEALGDIYKEGVIEPIFASQAYVATIAEKAIQLNHYLGLLRPVNAPRAAAFRKMSSMGAFRGYATTPEELFNRMSTAFVNPYTAGDITRNADRLGLIMFATYAFKTPFNVAKMVAQAPLPFVNWMRWESLMAQKAESEYDIRDIDLAEWEKEGNPYYLAAHENPYGQKEYALLFPNANSVRNAVYGFTNILEGFDKETTIHNVDEYDRQWTDMANDLLRNVALQSNPLIQTAIEFLTKRDLLTDMSLEVEPGDKMPSYLFWHVNPTLRNMLYRIAPITRAIDDWNPLEIFGSAPVYDANGVLLYNGKRGVLGNERYPVRALDRISASEPARAWMYRLITMSGFTVRVTNVPKNIQANLRQLDATIAEIKAQHGDKQKEFNLTPTSLATSPEEFERRRNELEELASLGLYLELERLKLTWYMNAGGQLTPEQLDKLNDEIHQMHGERNLNPIQQQYIELLEEYGAMYDDARRTLYGQP